MPLNINLNNPIISMLKNYFQHYNHKKYWKYREYVTNPAMGGKIAMLRKYLKLMYIKRCDAFNNASMGTDLNGGALFKTPPRLPHGLNGIIISPYAKIGSNITIFHQVTIADDAKDFHNAPTIGDNVMIGAGAILIGKITIGNNVKIGAGAIVVENIPDNAVVVGGKARIIIK